MKRQDWIIYGVTLTVSGLLHEALYARAGAQSAPIKPALHRVELAMVQKAPPPAPPKPPAPPNPLPKPPLPPRKPAPQPLAVTPPPPQNAPPAVPNAPPPKPDAPQSPPMFGISMQSVVTGGSGPSMPVGSSLSGGGRTAGTGSTAGAAPSAGLVPSTSLSRQPYPKGKCQADYTPEARSHEIEGRVVLDVEVRADGSVGSVSLISGLEYGLNEAAIAALKRCLFTPALLGNVAVATRIEYVYKFLLE